MVINSNIKQKRGGVKCHSPVLLHGKITMCRAGRPRNIIMWIQGWRKKLGEEGDENKEQFSNNEIQRVDVVSRYKTKVETDRRSV
jgi:hypothetical protein